MDKKHSTPKATKNMIGKRFGCWLVIGPAPRSPRGQARLMCRCDCGTVKPTDSYELRKGKTKSCGCAKGKHITESLSTFSGGVRVHEIPEYKVWDAMIQRCTNSNNKKYPIYGGRGIEVCARWLESFENFFNDMGKRPSKRHSLDRIDNENGHYTPENCRWATVRQQANNTRTNRLITFRGETRTMAQWARHLGIKYWTLSSRLNLYGWSVEKAFTEPVGDSAKGHG